MVIPMRMFPLHPYFALMPAVTRDVGAPPPGVRVAPFTRMIACRVSGCIPTRPPCACNVCAGPDVLVARTPRAAPPYPRTHPRSPPRPTAAVWPPLPAPVAQHTQ